MNRTARVTAFSLPTALALAGLAAAAWAAWLGWDQHYDVHPDGSTTGPYQPWQVIGLVLTLLTALVAASLRRHPSEAVLGITAGLTAAAFFDWSDDASGLYVVGVGMVMFGTLIATLCVSAVVSAATGIGRAPASRT